MTTPRQQVRNILAGRTADGHPANRRVPLKLFASDEKTLHQLSMVAADVLAALHAEGLEPTDYERTSVLYRMIAHLANRRSLKISGALRRRIRETAVYIARNTAHLTSDLSFTDLHLMARHAPRAPHKSEPDPAWLLRWIFGAVTATLEIGLALALTGFAAVGFCSAPQLIASPQHFRAVSVDGWRAILTAPSCAGDCRIPIPPHRRRG